MFALSPPGTSPAHRDAAGCRAAAPARRGPGRPDLRACWPQRPSSRPPRRDQPDPARRAAGVPAPAVRVISGGMAGWQITLIAVAPPWSRPPGRVPRPGAGHPPDRLGNTA